LQTDATGAISVKLSDPKRLGQELSRTILSGVVSRVIVNPFSTYGTARQ
jgi:hypothetical protein